MALRAFEAGARLGRFTLAAEELLLTQSAISRHVRNLEDFLGVMLFHRSGRNLVLTPEGREYMATVSDTFDRISAATRALCRRPRGSVLTVGMPSSISAKWFTSRLATLFQAYPDLDLRVRSVHEQTDFDGIDIAIRYGRGDWLGGAVEELLHETVSPVCSPAFAARLPAGAPSWFGEEGSAVTLLHGDMHEDWRMWLKEAGLERFATTRGPKFDDHTSLIQAAIAGLGVALGPGLLVADDVAAGRLTAPFPSRLPTGSSYWLVTPGGRSPHPRLDEFRTWLLDEIQRP
jgi:LysR family glycine cleavage system transcriptional activator